MQPTPINLSESTKLHEISLRDLAAVLVKHLGIHEGLYEVGFKLNISVGQVGTDADNLGPGAVMAIGGVALLSRDQAGPASVDASEVNPIVSKKTPKKTK